MTRRDVLAAGMLLTQALRAQSSPTTLARKVAITIDDGPVVGEMRDLSNFQRITAGLIQSLKSQNVPATIFINESQLNVQGQRDARAQALIDWLDAGFDLANHTYSHSSLNRVPLWQFQDDIVRGDVILRKVLAERNRKPAWFRYPFLHAGTTAEVHESILQFTEQRGYRIAPVTVDYSDYTFAGLYTRVLRAGDKETAEKIKLAYLDQLDIGFEHAERFSKELFGYEPPQILLIHCNELNSISLVDSIGRMRSRGYSFVTLDDAMSEKVYQRRDTFSGSGGS
jgi:peptidoglycan/xylan/chitin deacetylase (PgdA/CDA1 family)